MPVALKSGSLEWPDDSDGETSSVATTSEADSGNVHKRLDKLSVGTTIYMYLAKETRNGQRRAPLLHRTLPYMCHPQYRQKWKRKPLDEILEKLWMDKEGKSPPEDFELFATLKGRKAKKLPTEKSPQFDFAFMQFCDETGQLIPAKVDTFLFKFQAQNGLAKSFDRLGTTQIPRNQLVKLADLPPEMKFSAPASLFHLVNGVRFNHIKLLLVIAVPRPPASTRKLIANDHLKAQNILNRRFSINDEINGGNSVRKLRRRSSNDSASNELLANNSVRELRRRSSNEFGDEKQRLSASNEFLANNSDRKLRRRSSNDSAPNEPLAKKPQLEKQNSLASCSSSSSGEKSNSSKIPNGEKSNLSKIPNGEKSNASKIQNGEKSNLSKIPNGEKSNFSKIPNGVAKQKAMKMDYFATTMSAQFSNWKDGTGELFIVPVVQLNTKAYGASSEFTIYPKQLYEIQKSVDEQLNGQPRRPGEVPKPYVRFQVVYRSGETHGTPSGKRGPKLDANGKPKAKSPRHRPAFIPELQYRFVIDAPNNQNGNENGEEAAPSGASTGGTHEFPLNALSADSYRCPWCQVFVSSPFSLLMHLKHLHPRFKFGYKESNRFRTRAVVEVRLNEAFDAGFDTPFGSEFVGPQARAFRRKLGTSKCPTRFIVPRGMRKALEPKFDLSEFSVQTTRQRGRVHQDISVPVRPLMNRELFHSHFLRRLLPGDSDDGDQESGPDWLQWHIAKMIEDFIDVNSGEKQILKLWSLFLLKNNFMGQNQIPLACMKFVREFGPQLGPYRANLSLHLAQLHDFGLLNAREIHAIYSEFLKNCDKIST